MFHSTRFFSKVSFFFLFVPALILPANSSARQLIMPPNIEPKSVEPMKGLLIQHWQPGSENRAAVAAQHAQMQTKSPEWVLAYVANRLNDGRRKEALDAIESATVEHTQFLDGWLLRSHLHLVADQFDKGLVSLRSAKSAFDEKNATPKQRTDFYQRSGELIGYLQGPAGSRVDQKLLNSVIEHLMAGAADPDIATFRAATDQIRQKFIERQQSTQARLDAELQKQAAADAIQQDTLTARNQNLILNEQALRDRQSQLRHDLGQRESQLTSQLSPLHNNLVGLESQITAVQRNLQYLHSDLARAQNQSPVCPITVRAILDQVNRAEINLYTLQTNHQSYVMQLQTVQSQIQSTRAQYNDQLNEIQRELKRIGNSLNRNRNQLTRLAEGPKVASGKKEAGANRVTSLGSYVKLSPELIRQQLLESVK